MAEFRTYKKSSRCRSPSPRPQRRPRYSQSPEEGFNRGMRSDRRTSGSPPSRSPHDDRYDARRRRSPNSSNKSTHSRSGSKSRSRSPVIKHDRYHGSPNKYRRESGENKKGYGKSSYSNNGDQQFRRGRMEPPAYSGMSEKYGYKDENLHRSKVSDSSYEDGRGDREFQPGKVPLGAIRHCFNCGKEGHWKKECTENEEFQPGKVPLGAKRHCFNCGKEGHWKKECTENMYKPTRGFQPSSGNRKNEYSEAREKSSYKSSGPRDQRDWKERHDSSYEREKSRIYRGPHDRPSNYRHEESHMLKYNSKENMCNKSITVKEEETELNRSDGGRGGLKKPRQLNARNETRAAIMAMMETMTKMPSKDEQHIDSTDLVKAKENPEYLDENSNVRGLLSETKYGQKNNVDIVRTIVYNVMVEGVLDILFPLPVIKDDKEKKEKIGPQTSQISPLPTRTYHHDRPDGETATTSIDINTSNEIASKNYSTNSNLIYVEETQAMKSAETQETKNVDVELKPASTMLDGALSEVLTTVSKVRRTPPASPIDQPHNNVPRQAAAPVANPRDPRKKALEQGASSVTEQSHVYTNIYTKPRNNLKEQLIKQGVPEQTFYEEDGFQKMRLTFSGRIHVVKGIAKEECSKIANLMIECCQKAFDDYLKLADRYIQARIHHMKNSVTTGYFPEENVSDDDMSTAPPLLELRSKLHKQLYITLGKMAKLPFKFSEVVDLSMYYFNHVASCKSWRKHNTNC